MHVLLYDNDGRLPRAILINTAASCHATKHKVLGTEAHASAQHTAAKYHARDL